MCQCLLKAMQMLDASRTRVLKMPKQLEVQWGCLHHMMPCYHLLQQQQTVYPRPTNKSKLRMLNQAMQSNQYIDFDGIGLNKRLFSGLEKLKNGRTVFIQNICAMNGEWQVSTEGESRVLYTGEEKFGIGNHINKNLTCYPPFSKRFSCYIDVGNSRGGNEMDKVYLLSMAETNKFLKDLEEFGCVLTAARSCLNKIAVQYAANNFSKDYVGIALQVLKNMSAAINKNQPEYTPHAMDVSNTPITNHTENSFWKWLIQSVWFSPTFPHDVETKLLELCSTLSIWSNDMEKFIPNIPMARAVVHRFGLYTILHDFAIFGANGLDAVDPTVRKDKKWLEEGYWVDIMKEMITDEIAFKQGNHVKQAYLLGGAQQEIHDKLTQQRNDLKSLSVSTYDSTLTTINTFMDLAKRAAQFIYQNRSMDLRIGIKQQYGDITKGTMIFVTICRNDN